MSYAPIIVPVYDRLEHLKRCISALQTNAASADSDLYIISDAAYRQEDVEKINQVRSFASDIQGFKSLKLIFREENFGAHKSIEEGIKEVLKATDSFIFLEDDIIVSSNFLQYMNDGLKFYKEDKQCFSICAFRLPFQMPATYSKDIYFYPCNSPWGFATWKERWEEVDYSYRDRYAELKQNRKKYKQFLSVGFFIKGILQADSRKEIEAGDLRVYYHMFQRSMYAVFPIVSRSQNWGFDGTGEHCNNTRAWWVKPELSNGQMVAFEPFDTYNQAVLENQRKFQDQINGGTIAKYLKYTWIHRLYKKIILFFRYKK